MPAKTRDQNKLYPLNPGSHFILKANTRLCTTVEHFVLNGRSPEKLCWFIIITSRLFFFFLKMSVFEMSEIAEFAAASKSCMDDCKKRENNQTMSFGTFGITFICFLVYII